MTILGKVHAACWLLVAASAAAQTAKPAAEASAAMERAKRQAAGPMRIILEASKARRKAGDPETPVAAEPVAKSAAVRTAGTSAAQPAPADARLLVATTSNGDAVRTIARQATAAEPTPAQPLVTQPTATQPPAPQASLPDATPPPSLTLSSEVLQSKEASAAVASLQATATPPLSSATLAQPAALPFSIPLPAAAPAVAAAARPRLLTMVEPELSQRVLDQLGRNATVLMDLTIRADGSVAQVTVLPPSSRQLERALAPTLQQWKFEPSPAERVHRVELVFNPER